MLFQLKGSKSIDRQGKKNGDEVFVTRVPLPISDTIPTFA